MSNNTRLIQEVNMPLTKYSMLREKKKNSIVHLFYVPPPHDSKKDFVIGSYMILLWVFFRIKIYLKKFGSWRDIWHYLVYICDS